MLNNLTGWHFLIILVVILLLFGAPKLPALARSLGQSMKILKQEVASDKKPDVAAPVAGGDGSATTTSPPVSSSVDPGAAEFPAKK